MKAQKIQITKYSSSYIDSVRFYIELICLIKNIRITSNDNLIISTFMIEGYNEFTKTKIIEELKLCKNKQVLTNCISKYRTLGILVKDSHSETLCKELNMSLATQLNLIELKLLNK
jgi:hypothetical protein